MTRPKIKIELDPIDKFINGAGILGILLLIVLPLYFYPVLPEMIPSHYGFDGVADGFNDKSSIWVLPILGVVMYIGMAVLNKYPHIFNYPKEITEENAESLYRIVGKMIRVLNTLFVCVFAYIMYSSIQTALGNQLGLGGYFAPVLLIVMFTTMGYFLYKSIK